MYPQDSTIRSFLGTYLLIILSGSCQSYKPHDVHSPLLASFPLMDIRACCPIIFQPSIIQLPVSEQDNGDIQILSNIYRKIPHSTAFQTDDLDAFDSYYDEALSYFEQPDFNNNPDIDITSDSNMISYEQYLKETKNTVVQDTFAQNDAMIMSVIEEMSNQVAKYPQGYLKYLIGICYINAEEYESQDLGEPVNHKDALSNLEFGK
ncbi:hypothetical protein Tco_0719066 [Tanacetum coccineum]